MTIEDDVKKLITDNALDLTRVLIKQATEESDVKTAMYLLNKILPNYTKPEPKEPDNDNEDIRISIIERIITKPGNHNE